MANAADPRTGFLRLAAGALIVLVAEPIYLLIDLAVVGRLGGDDLAALSVGTLALGVVSTQLTFLSYGTTARAARAFGAGRRRDAVAEGVQASWVAIGVGLAIVLAVQLLAPVVVPLLAPQDHVADLAVTWLRIASAGVPLILLSMAGNGWLRAVQDPRRPAIYVVTGVVLSAVLCPLLVHGIGLPRLGIEGSAVANLVGQGTAGVLFLGRLAREAQGQWRPRPAVIRAQLTMGRDLIVRSLSFQVCFLSAAAVAARFGVAALAAHQTVLQVWNFTSMVLDAFAIATQALVGAALGAGAVQRARAVGAMAIRWSLISAVTIAAVFAALAPVIGRAFTSDRAVLDAFTTPWWFLVAMLPIAGIVFAIDGILLGGGDAAYLRTATLTAALIGFLPIIWLSYAFDWGLAGIWSGLVVFMLARLATLVLRFRGDNWTGA